MGPILGGWATENSGFESACWITSSGSLIFTLSFIVMNLKNVKKQITPLPDIQQPLIQSYEEEYENIKPKEDFKTDLSFIKTPRTYVTRYRAFSSSSRNSRRSSYAT